jgi:CRP/FNR family cyclic AMP-dependent transcriptional regulator
MKPIDELLAGHRFFKEFSQPMLQTLASQGTFKQEPPGRFVVHEGDPAGMLVILKGKLRVETHGPGQEGTPFETLSVGDVFGSSWTFPPNRWVFDLVAVEPVEIVYFEGQALRQIVETDSKLGTVLLRQLVRILTERLRSSRMLLSDVYRHPTQ